MIRFKRVLALSAISAVLASGASCGRRQTDTDALRVILTRSALLSRSFVYEEKTPQNAIVVQGAVADDFRYKALVSLDGQPAFDEVVTDDAVADRVLDPRGFSMFSRQGPAKGTPPPSLNPDTTSTAPAGELSPVDALRARQWVVDPVGAPSLLPSATDKHTLGSDPIYDSLNVFHYVEDAIHISAGVVKFSPESLTYKPQEDPFPKPAKGSGVIRYDIARRPLPRPSTTGAGGNQEVPDVNHFRKMSVYVKDGVIIQVREDVDVASRLGDLSRLYNVKFSAGQTVDQRVAQAVAAINSVRQGQGNAVIRVRTMSLKLVDVGKAPAIDLPSATVTGSLALFENRGQLLVKPAA
jgi:hypothetical protein